MCCPRVSNCKHAKKIFLIIWDGNIVKLELLNIYLMFTSNQFLRGSRGQRFISCLGLRSMEMTVWEGRWTKNDTGEAEDP